MQIILVAKLLTADRIAVLRLLSAAHEKWLKSRKKEKIFLILVLVGSSRKLVSCVITNN